MLSLVRIVTVLLFSGASVSAATVQADTAVTDSRSIITLPDDAIASAPALALDTVTVPRLIILLHGAGQGPAEMIARFMGDADCADAVLLAPKSRGSTWDVVWIAQRQALEGTVLNSAALRYTDSNDAVLVMAAVANLAQRMKTDPARQTLLGFSDGASFALALGTGRDRPFTSVVVLSPGIDALAARPARGRPVFIMHGTKDKVLPFALTRSTIIPALRSSGLAVTFTPFDGGHEMVSGLCAKINSALPQP
jgi:phospholipase/carboxylesterase